MFLLNLVPPLYRWLAIGLMVVAVWGHGYVKGRVAGENKVEAVTARLQSERDQQALKTARKVIQDKEKLSETITDFHSGIAAINAYWLRQPKAAPRLPPGSTVAQGVTTGCPDAVPLGQYQELEQGCAVTTQMFNSCRDGWIKQE